METTQAIRKSKGHLGFIDPVKIAGQYQAHLPGNGNRPFEVYQDQHGELWCAPVSNAFDGECRIGRWAATSYAADQELRKFFGVNEVSREEDLGR